jgi:hypothetical protein
MVGMGIAVYGEYVGMGNAPSRKCANRGEYENLLYTYKMRILRGRCAPIFFIFLAQIQPLGFYTPPIWVVLKTIKFIKFFL